MNPYLEAFDRWDEANQSIDKANVKFIWPDWPPKRATPKTVRLVANPRCTHSLFFRMSDLAGKVLDVQDPVDSEGKIACWCPGGQRIVFVDQRDVDSTPVA